MERIEPETSLLGLPRLAGMPADRSFDPRTVVSHPPKAFLPVRTTGASLRPRDLVWLARNGVGCRATVVEVRGEQVRVVIGGRIAHLPTEDVIGVLRRGLVTSADGRDESETGDRDGCRWTPAGWNFAAR